MRAHYEELMAHPDRIEEVLQAGAQKARTIATPFIQELRQAVGLRTLSAAPVKTKSAGKAGAGKGARFVSFRDEGGQFRFRFLGQEGTELFCSIAFADPKVAGAAMRALQEGTLADMIELTGELDFSLRVDGQVIALGVTSVSAEERAQRLDALRTGLQPA